MEKIPFIFGKIVSGKNFINRDKERKHLSSNLVSGVNTILISPRRWGKSSLVSAVADAVMQEDKKVIFCNIDLFNVRNEKDFYQLLTREVLKISASKWQERLDFLRKLIKNIIPKITMGVGTDQDVSVSFDWKELQQHTDEILDLPEKIAKSKGIRIVVCLDEFQNIAFFGEHLAFQKRLRAAWQKHQHITYCLYGSKRHMMMHLFENKSMPFYKFGEVMYLQKIDTSYWKGYISNSFKKTGRVISVEQAEVIAQTMENHPYFVQQYAQTVWRNTEKNCTEKILEDSLEELFTQHTILFQREIDNLTNPQINLLKAICDEVKQLSSAETLYNYDLGTSATVKRSKEALENKEILDLTNKEMQFLDPLFKCWMKKVYMKN